ncbi:MAG: DUF1905 domain-containing protein [Tepidisphaeraceae bacterium]
MTVQFKAKLWRYDGKAAWHFVTLPKGKSAQIKSETRGLEAGFGSLRVDATIGKTTWQTSIFPDTKRGAYLLPVKKQVMKAESIEVDASVMVTIKLVDAMHTGPAR